MVDNHHVAGFVGMFFSLLLGVGAFPMQIIKLKKSVNADSLSSIFIVIPALSYPVWTYYAMTFPEGIDWILTVVYAVGAINAIILLIVYKEKTKGCSWLTIWLLPLREFNTLFLELITLLRVLFRKFF